MITKPRIFPVCDRRGMSFAGLFLAFPILILAAQGDLDLSFGNGGKVVTPIGSSYDFANSVAMQSDGKIVAAGSSTNGANSDFAVVRYNSNGSLDTSFNGTGKVVTPIGSSGGAAYSVTIQSDGKIVAAGYASNGVDGDLAVVRYNSNGSLDTSFNGTGKVVTQVSSASGDAAYSVTIQADGKIVAAGSSYNGTDNDFVVIRYNTNGTLDTSFSSTGKVITQVGVGDAVANSVGIQSDGKIVAAGYCVSEANGGDFAVVRYNTDGSLDTSFNGSGKVVTSLSNSSDYASSVAIQPDGKIVVAGRSSTSTGGDFAVVRYNNDGTLDTSFSGTGKVATSIGSNSNDYAASVGIQSDGKIVAAGGSNSGNFDFAVVRYNTDGTLDTSFSATGMVVTSISPRGDRANSVAIQPDGKIVAAGQSNNGSDHDFALVRYLGTSNAATVGGRVLTPDGRGLRNAIVAITDSLGVSRTVTTSSLGYYSFESVPLGQTSTIAVSSRRYRFESQNVRPDGNLLNVDFTGLE